MEEDSYYYFHPSIRNIKVKSTHATDIYLLQTREDLRHLFCPRIIHPHIKEVARKESTSPCSSARLTTLTSPAGPPCPPSAPHSVCKGPPVNIPTLNLIKSFEKMVPDVYDDGAGQPDHQIRPPLRRLGVQRPAAERNRDLLAGGFGRTSLLLLLLLVLTRTGHPKPPSHPSDRQTDKTRLTRAERRGRDSIPRRPALTNALADPDPGSPSTTTNTGARSSSWTFNIGEGPTCGPPTWSGQGHERGGGTPSTSPTASCRCWGG